MSRRYVAFLVALVGAGIQLFGAVVGQGILGDGMLFGAAGPETVSAGALLGLLAAIASLAAAVLVMLVRDVRPLVAVLVTAAVVGTLAAGLIFGAGAALAAIGALIALTVDRSASLT